MYLSLTNGTVPTNWEKVAYPSLKPLTAWFEDLIKRVDFLNKWLTEGSPMAYWISGFFFPQGFMTGCLQTHARLYRIAIDELSFSFEVLEFEEPSQVEERAKDGVFIYGVYMDGARYNREQKCIDEQIPVSTFNPLANFDNLIGRTVRPHATDPLQAREGLLAERGRVLLPHVQDWAQKRCALHDWPVDQLRDQRRVTMQLGDVPAARALDPQSCCTFVPAERLRIAQFDIPGPSSVTEWVTTYNAKLPLLRTKMFSLSLSYSPMPI